MMVGGRTNVEAELMRPYPSKQIVAWTDRQPAVEVFITVAELLYGIGRPISMAAAEIAAICRSHGATVATRNVDDFADIDVAIVNPWTAS